MLAAVLVGPIKTASAVGWSTCQTITGVSNYLAYANSVLLSFSPGISGCSPAAIPGAVSVSVGSEGVTTDNINSFLATSLVAYSASHQVMVYYDNSTINCMTAIISVGGPGGQCP
jgi:hypothetical protein